MSSAIEHLYYNHKMWDGFFGKLKCENAFERESKRESERESGRENE